MGLNLLNILSPINIPMIVENSASPLLVEPMISPLRARMATEATADVKIPGINPKRRADTTIGIPVKSNLR